MKRSKLERGIFVAAIIGIGSAATHDLTRSHTVQAQSIHSTPPATAKRPQAVVDLASALSQTSAVVEGVVNDIQYEYTDAEGPWTRIMLSNVRAHFGESAPYVELKQFGGPLPNGKTLVAAELPSFERGQRYVVFLRNTAWNVSPVVGDLSFRVDVAEGAEVLVNSDDQPITQVGAAGFELGPALFETPQRAGAQSRSLGLSANSLAGARRSFDRRGFVQALQTAMTTQGLRVGGPFYDRPAGEFKWRAQPTARVGVGRAIGAAPTGNRALERDLSDQERR